MNDFVSDLFHVGFKAVTGGRSRKPTMIKVIPAVVIKT